MTLPQPVPPPSGPVRSPSRWRLVRRAYCVAAGIVMALVYLALRFAVPEHLRDLAIALAMAALGLVLTLAAFRLSRATSMGRVDDLTRRVEQAVEAGGLPELEQTGWSAFDALAQAISRFATQRAETVARVRAECDHFRMLAEDAISLEAYFGGNGRLLWVNPAIEAITGYTVAECLKAHDLIDQWIYTKDQALMRDLARRSLLGESREDHELRIQHRGGGVTWFACRWHPRRDDLGRVVGVRFSAQNIQRRKDAELKLLETVAALRRAQALKEHYLNRSNEERMRLASLLDVVKLGILFVDRDHRVVYINQPALDIWNLGMRDTVVGARDEVLIERTIHLRADDEAYRAHVAEVLSHRGFSEPYDIEMSDGRIIRDLSAIVPALEGEGGIGRVWIYEDVTEELRAAQRLTDLAERDPLTGLFNRRRFMEELERQIADAMRRGEQLGLLSFDLDGFKAVNDTHGHQAGDEVLIRLASELSAVIRRNEMLFRLGGDEFALLVSNTDAEPMEQLARRVLQRVSDIEFRFSDQAVSITVSMGIALAPHHAGERNALIAMADRAMYAAKMQGKNRMQFAEPGEHDPQS
ncbi:diguanylate cyclase domain-containing protein [Uliginosibacterium sp. H1]|uniref:diguanylate cyclase domain-containing protein n=1 Tax=Uliginosibacterium sp. H1 TaxID=3114757 RepID=UPI002E16FB28|nr:diguanylate cyclase [Uliginosibacterium sp. H1]